MADDPSGTRTSDGKKAPRARGAVKAEAADPPVVALGASAGGLKALRAFFESTRPDTGFAFVVIQHLDPTHKSMMTDLLSRRTEMEVSEVRDRMRVQANHVYMIPPDEFMAIEDGELRLSEGWGAERPRMTIDYFFQSLARGYGEKAVGVVLSGTGSDGAAGLREIKLRGGTTLVQDPETAEYAQMPRQAIHSGRPHAVLPVEEIGRALDRIAARTGSGEVRKGEASGGEARAGALRRGAKNLETDRAEADRVASADRDPGEAETGGSAGETDGPEGGALTRAVALLRTRTGFDFRLYKRNTLWRRLDRRVGLSDASSMREYLTRLRRDRGELEQLAHDLLIDVSGFFRDAEVFHALEREVFPRLFEDRGPEDTVRVWVPGCAGGEEAYSIAMGLIEHQEKLDYPPGLQVFATDVSREALETARAGLYTENQVERVPAERRERFFKREAGGRLRVRKELRETVLFAPQNVLTDPPFSRVDLLSCRNLLIYLETEAQRRLLRVFHFALRPGGYLLLGSSESVGRREDLFEPIVKRRRLYRRVDRAGREPLDFPLSSMGGGERPRPREGGEAKKPAGARNARKPQNGFGELVHQVLLEDYAPACVLVNGRHEVLYSHGDVRRYLDWPTGEPTRDLLELAPAGLENRLRGAVHKAIREERTVRVTRAPVDRGGERRLVDVEARPVHRTGEPRGLLLVSFADGEYPEPTAAAPEVGSEAERAVYIRQIEDELRATKEDLSSYTEEMESANEELKASNEEITSMNEELQSTNEELETSQEELRSLNEEVNATNSELQEKVREVERVNDDLENLLNNTRIAAVFLDSRLRVRLFTPATDKLFHLIASDEGRPITDISWRFTDESLLRDVEEVLKKLMPIEKEVSAEGGLWYLRRIMPYRTRENRIDGVAITFLNVSDQKRALIEREELLARVRAEERRLETILRRMASGVVIAEAPSGRITLINERARLMFRGSSPMGRNLDEDAGWEAMRPDGAPYAPADLPLARAMRDGETVWGEEMRFRLPDGVEVWLGVNAAPIYEDGERVAAAVASFEDLTERKRAEANLRELTDTLERRVRERTAQLGRRSEQMRSLAMQLSNAEQRERRRLAQALHDSLQQELAAAKMRLGMLRQAAGEDTVRELEGVEELIGHSIQSTRTLTFDLSPPILYDAGLAAALEWLARHVDHAHGLKVDVAADAEAEPEREEASGLLFQAVRELLFNTVKHAGVQQAWVRLERTAAEGGEGDCVRITVEDHGKGFDARALEEKEKKGERESGFGLFSIRERMELMGGGSEIVSAPGEGCRATLWLPVVPVK